MLTVCCPHLLASQVTKRICHFRLNCLAAACLFNFKLNLLSATSASTCAGREAASAAHARQTSMQRDRRCFKGTCCKMHATAASGSCATGVGSRLGLQEVNFILEGVVSQLEFELGASQARHSKAKDENADASAGCYTSVVYGCGCCIAHGGLHIYERISNELISRARPYLARCESMATPLNCVI